MMARAHMRLRLDVASCRDSEAGDILTHRVLRAATDRMTINLPVFQVINSPEHCTHQADIAARG